MICFVKGVIDQVLEQSVYVDVQGVGYEVWVPSSVLVSVKIGDLHKLYTYQHIREEDLRLFGFLEKQDLEIFTLLISVNGVGPKAGLAILSSYNADQVCEAVLREDDRLFASVSGIGKKGAAKIVLELKGKVAGIIKTRGEYGLQDKISLPTTQNDLIDALVSLGYVEREIYQHLHKVDQTVELNLQIKQALSLLAKK